MCWSRRGAEALPLRLGDTGPGDHARLWPRRVFRQDQHARMWAAKQDPQTRGQRVSACHLAWSW